MLSRSVPTGTPRIGLALVDPPSYDAAVIEELESAGVAVTFFVRPEVLIQDSVRWRFVKAAGHELGNGCLLGVTDDGRLPNWTCATIESEFRDCSNLLEDLGQLSVSSIYLPGRYHVCADGRYRHKLQQAFDVCIGEAERSGSLQGVCGAFDFLTAPGPARSHPTVLAMTADPSELRHLLPLLPKLLSGPVSDLVYRNPHT